jgi:hypothetical protein
MFSYLHQARTRELYFTDNLGCRLVGVKLKLIQIPAPYGHNRWSGAVRTIAHPPAKAAPRPSGPNSLRLRLDLDSPGTLVAASNQQIDGLLFIDFSD